MGPFSKSKDTPYDIETAPEKQHMYTSGTESADDVAEDGAVHSGELIKGNSLSARAQRFASKFGVEARGIERVPNDERTDGSLSQIATLVRFDDSPRFTLWHSGREKV